MDLQQIKYFLAVVDCGTFLAASRAVHVSQPTLSAGIRKLEESLDVTLFNRGSRAASLTPAGEQFLLPARQAYNQLQSARAKLSEQSDKILIGVQTNIHMDHVAKIIGAHRLSHPHILIELQVADSDELTRLLQQQKLDLIIVNSNARSANFTPLFAEQLCLVVPERHPLAEDTTASLEALNGELFIERVNCSFWTEVNQALLSQGINPHRVMQSDSDEFVLSLVAANLGISVITDRNTPYGVRFIPLSDVSIDRRIGISYTPGSRASHVDQFCATLLEQYGA